MPVFTWRNHLWGRPEGSVITEDKAKSGVTSICGALVISVHVCAATSCPGKDNIGHMSLEAGDGYEASNVQAHS